MWRTSVNNYTWEIVLQTDHGIQEKKVGMVLY